MFNPVIEHQTWHRWSLYIVFIAAAGATGYWQGLSNRKVVTIEHAAETLIEYRDRIVVHEKIIHPDGTIEERDTTHDTATDTHHTESDSSTTSTPSLPEYAFGLRYDTKYSDLLPSIIRPDIGAAEVTVGRRILGPVWVEVGAGVQRFSLGVRYEF